MYLHIYVYIFTYIHTYTHIYTHMCVYIHMDMYINFKIKIRNLKNAQRSGMEGMKDSNISKVQAY